MRGFTLLEAMLALAISGIVVASATVATVSIYRTLLAKQQQADADDQARAIVDYVGGTLMKIGNDYVVPAAVVSNTCWSTTTTPCTGDGLRFVELDPSLAQVEIESVDSVKAPLQSTPTMPAKANIRRVGSTCPLSLYPTSSAVDVVMLPPDGAMGAGWIAARCQATANADNCSCALSAVTLVGTAPPSGAPHGATSAEPVVYPYPASGWILAPGQAVTMWHKRDTKELFESRDLAGDGNHVTRLLSDSIWEFRIQFAFEGSVVGNLDPWTSKPNAELGATLRAVRIGVIGGARAPSRSTASTATLFPGEAGAVTASEQSGVLLRAASSTFMLRNTLRYTTN
jgi:prepilin-type N-terminal cleavage/methylation domain-containing protein